MQSASRLVLLLLGIFLRNLSFLLGQKLSVNLGALARLIAVCFCQSSWVLLS